jgi:hypothetical protein
MGEGRVSAALLSIVLELPRRAAEESRLDGQGASDRCVAFLVQRPNALMPVGCGLGPLGEMSPCR